MPRGIRQNQGPTVRERLQEFFEANPDGEYTAGQLAQELGIDRKTMSASMSQYLEWLPVNSIKGERPPGQRGGRVSYRYTYDPTKKVRTDSPYQGKQARIAARKAARVPVPRPKPPAVEPRPHLFRDDIFAKVIFQDDRDVILITTDKQVIKGRILQ